MVESSLGVAQLGLRAGQLGFEAGTVVRHFRDRRGDGLLEQVGSGESLNEVVDDGSLQVFGGDSLALAAVGALGLAVPAGVVAVEAGAALGTRPEVGAAARPTPEHAGQQVLRRVRRPALDQRGSLVEERSGPGEQIVVDDRGVLALVDLIAVGDLADVDRVAQHSEDGLVAPEPVAAVA
ncbi:MAG TPA: hypothetical protein VND62_02495 [Acidimicrobiales bacterium]|nr:hypothetical protein [Acidimicrobiales bacterium]